jgi:hypothetical protein
MRARERPYTGAIVGEQGQLPRVGMAAFGQSVLDVVAQRMLKASMGSHGMSTQQWKNETRWAGA